MRRKQNTKNYKETSRQEKKERKLVSGLVNE